MADPRRRVPRTDAVLAEAVLVLEALVCLTLWGPQPIAWLWVGSQATYHTGGNFLGVVVAFFGIVASTFVTLAVALRVDHLWRLLRRAAGHDQREGVLARMFAAVRT